MFCQWCAAMVCALLTLLTFVSTFTLANDDESEVSQIGQRISSSDASANVFVAAQGLAEEHGDEGDDDDDDDDDDEGDDEDDEGDDDDDEGDDDDDEGDDDDDEGDDEDDEGDDEDDEGDDEDEDDDDDDEGDDDDDEGDDEDDDDDDEGDDEDDDDDKKAKEVEIRFDECPKVVRKTFRRESRRGLLEHDIDKVTIGDDVKYYEADANIGGWKYEIKVRPDGVLIAKTLEHDD